MDFYKVIDQTVRDLKREVNKTILKVPEIEQKVLDATSNEPWGPHGTLMAEIAQATRNYYELQMIMAVLWKRLSDTGRNWRHVYKALTVLVYLVANGSERVIDDIKEHVYQITTLADFQYVEANGKDQGINVRKKSQNLVLLVNDKEKIREVRQKAADNRDKYGGVSSSGGMSKPSSYQSTGGSYAGDRHAEENYGRYGMRDGDRYSRDRDVDRYRDDDRYGRDSDRPSRHSDQYGDLHKEDDVDYYSSRKGHDHDFDSTDCQSSRRPTEKPATASDPLGYKEASQSPDYHTVGDQRELKPFAGQSVSASSANTPPANNIPDDFDDFNPRATSVAAPSTSQLDDLFDQSEPSGVVRASLPRSGSSTFWGDTSDLFGDSVSSNVMPAPPINSVENLGGDLFGNSPFKVEASGSTSLTAVKVAIKPPPSYRPTGNGMKASFLPSSGTLPTSITPPPLFLAGNVVATVAGATFDTFTPVTSSANQAASVVDDFFGLDNFSTSGAVSNRASQPAFSLNAQAPPQPALSGAFQTSQPLSTSSFNPSQPFVGTASQGQSENTRPQQEKRFETKSAVWADSLSKGLIDLNIAGPKSNSTAGIGIDFDKLRTERIKDGPLSTCKNTTGMGKAMGSGSGLGVAGASARVPPAMPIGMVPNMGMGMGMNMGLGAGMGPMIGKNSSLGGFSNQQQQYGGSR